MKYNHLNVPTHWRNYWTRYPEGHTILEALIGWVSQVDDMVDNQNTLNDNVEKFRNEIDDFIGRFDERLRDEVTVTLKDWQASGFLNFLINEILDTKYHEMDERLTTQLAQTTVEAFRKKDLEDLTPRALSAIEGGEGTSFDLLSIPQDNSVTEIKTTFMKVSDEKYVTVNLMPNELGELGVYYDPSSGNPVTSEATMTFKATGKITKGDFDTMESFGAHSWIFYNSENNRINSQELNPDVVTEVVFPTDTTYVIGNIKDQYFPIDDPNRSPNPKGVATATIVKTNRKYNIKDLIIEGENLSEELKATILKTTFEDKEVSVNLMSDELGELGVYYDPSSGNPVKTEATMTFKATGKITKGDFDTMESFGVRSWIFYNSDNSRISSQELNDEDVVTEVAFPTDTAYVIGNIKDQYFPLDDPDRSPYPKGVATANVVITHRKYHVKGLIIDNENLSEEIKTAIKKEKQGNYTGKIVVNLGDSIIEGTNPSISDVVEDELGSTTINGGFGGCMMCPHPDEEFTKFSMTSVADAIATGNWSIQENATGVPAGFKNTVARLKAVDWGQVYCVVISYGTNDWLNSNPLDNSSDKYDKASYLGALRYSVRKLLQTYPNLKILVTAPIFRSTNDRTENSTNWKNGNGLLLSGYVEGLNTVGKEIFIPIADTFYGLGVNEWNESFYFPENDGTHPNAIGRQLLGQKIANTIRYVY